MNLVDLEIIETAVREAMPTLRDSQIDVILRYIEEGMDAKCVRCDDLRVIGDKNCPACVR